MSVEVRGTADAPLFNARHVAKITNDSQYVRNIEKMSKHLYQLTLAEDDTGHRIYTLFITEKGLSEYLSRRRGASAKSLLNSLPQSLQNWRDEIFAATNYVRRPGDRYGSLFFFYANQYFGGECRADLTNPDKIMPATASGFTCKLAVSSWLQELTEYAKRHWMNGDYVGYGKRSHATLRWLEDAYVAKNQPNSPVKDRLDIQYL